MKVITGLGLASLAMLWVLRGAILPSETSGDSAAAAHVASYSPASGAASQSSIGHDAARDVRGTTPRVRRVWDTADVSGAVSPDGRHLAYTDWSTGGDLAIRDLITGTNRRITHRPPGSGEYALGATFSPDGKQIAYGWSNERFFFELRVIALEGSEPRIIYSNEQVGYVEPARWSPDGGFILTLLSRGSGANQIAWVSANDGSVRVLKSLDWRSPSRLDLSPDGRYVLYDVSLREDQPARDVYVLATDGHREARLVEGAADDRVMGWAPDGGHVLFSSDRGGTPGAWLVPVAGGEARAAPVLVKPDLWRMHPVGFTRHGAFYYGVNVGDLSIRLATLDPKSGKMVGAPAVLSQRAIDNVFGVEWSPDGQYLVYAVREAPRSRRPATLVVRAVETGQERELNPRLSSMFRPRWSPDGRRIVVSGEDSKGRAGIYLIELQTAAVEPVVYGDPPRAYDQWPVWSRDGSIVFYQHGTPDSTSVVSHELATGREHVLFRAAPTAVGYELAVSPAGAEIAFSLSDQETRGGRIMAMPVNGGEARELVSSSDGVRPIAWQRDGLVYQSKGLWRAALDGAPQKLELDLASPMHWRYRFDAEGRRVAWVGGSWRNELWVIENFLPRTTSRAPGTSDRGGR